MLMVNIIDEKTRVSFFAVCCALPFVIGAIMWLTNVDAKATQARDEVMGLRALTIDIRERQVRMEQMVQDLTQRSNK
jgi:hypothetical protein